MPVNPMPILRRKTSDQASRNPGQGRRQAFLEARRPGPSRKIRRPRDQTKQPEALGLYAGRVMAGEPRALIDQIGEIAGCGVEHLVLEFLSEDGRALDEQMDAFASEVRPAF